MTALDRTRSIAEQVQTNEGGAVAGDLGTDPAGTLAINVNAGGIRLTGL